MTNGNSSGYNYDLTLLITLPEIGRVERRNGKCPVLIGGVNTQLSYTDGLRKETNIRGSRAH